jgi:hypothetical protein
VTDLFSTVRVGVMPQGPWVPFWRNLPPDVSLGNASERRREGHACSGEVGREHPSRCGPGCPPQHHFLHPFHRVSAAPIICGTGFPSFRQPTVATC